jgi:hypothetical protein
MASDTARLLASSLLSGAGWLGLLGRIRTLSGVSVAKANTMEIR